MSSSVSRSPEEQAKLAETIRELFEHKIVFNEFLGFRMGECSTQSVSIEFDMRNELIGHYMHGRLHGGVISSVLDAACGLAVIWAVSDYHAKESVEEIMERFKALATIDIRIDYLRPGIGSVFRAEASVVRLGKRIAATQASLVSDTGKEIASASGTYIVS